MVYKYPEQSKIDGQIDKADALLSARLGRYIPPANYETFRNECKAMSKRYRDLASAHCKGGFFSMLGIGAPNPLREKQCEMIEHLAENLSADQDENKKVLLGALFYRMLRLQQQQDNGWISHPAKDVKTFQVVCEVLHISHQSPNIDSLTLHTCLRSFLAYVQHDKVQQEVEYIREDPDFILNVQKLIEKHADLSREAQQQYHTIIFVQGLKSALRDLQKEIHSFLDKAATRSVTQQQMLQMLVPNPSSNSLELATHDNAMALIKEWWPDNFVLQASSVQQLKEIFDAHCNLSLFGALYLSGHRSNESGFDSSHKAPDKLLLQSIINNNELDIIQEQKDRDLVLRSIEDLETFVRSVSLQPNLLEVWGSNEHLLQAILQMQVNIKELPAITEKAMGLAH